MAVRRGELSGSNSGLMSDDRLRIKPKEEGLRSLVERIFSGTITANDFKKIKLGEAEKEAIEGFVRWLVGQYHYQLKDESLDLRHGSDFLIEKVEEETKEELKRMGWFEVSSVDWDALIKKTADTYRDSVSKEFSVAFSVCKIEPIEGK